MKKILLPVIAVWTALTLGAWLCPPRDRDDAERRALAQRPDLTWESAVSGRFQTEFDAFSRDQFPFRQGFRRIKAVFHRYVLGQPDCNGIYLARGHAVGQVYPLREDALDHAISRFRYLRQRCLEDSPVKMAIIPDKNYYLASESGQPSADYQALFQRFREEMPWAEQIDLTRTLTAEDFYRTDLHWRQERLFPAAAALCRGLGVTPPKPEDYRVQTLERPFYGVYCGQAALPLRPDTMALLVSEPLEACVVWDYETGKTLGIYDESKLTAGDLYEVFLSGPKSLLRIENPAASTDRELLIFRDSFASAMVPLLLGDYRTVTLIDIRYIPIDQLDRFLDFHGQEVLLLYSALVLNNGETIL